MNLPEYLKFPDQIQFALDKLDENCNNKDFHDLPTTFIDNLGLGSGHPFPIVRAYTKGKFCRGRIHREDFKIANYVHCIGANEITPKQGRANCDNMPIFYASNCVRTATHEILNSEPNREYDITFGTWENPVELTVANLLFKDDADFKKLKFIHSDPMEYIKGWPSLQKTSAKLLFNYFREKFKMVEYPGLYNITNVLASILYCLEGIEGISYASVSNQYDGVNFAFRNYKNLKCIRVQRMKFIKEDGIIPPPIHIDEGRIHDNSRIYW